MAQQACFPTVINGDDLRRSQFFEPGLVIRDISLRRRKFRDNDKYVNGTSADVNGQADPCPVSSPCDTLARCKFLNAFNPGCLFRRPGLCLNDPNWDYKSFNLERDGKLAHEKLAQVLNATDPNLKAFNARGGKLILYHGWNDAALPPVNTINYFESVVAKLGQRQTNSFVRLFMAPGVQHCNDGPGPDRFGQFVTKAQSDPQHDLTLALERWVEQGIAPEQVIATKRADGSTQRTRPLCPYPQVSRYKGSGSTDDAANFNCVTEQGQTGRFSRGPGSRK